MSGKEHWKKISKLLSNAAFALPVEPQEHRTARSSAAPVGPLTGTLTEFHEFLRNNEFELAWDALASVAVSCKASDATWLLLAKAARLMKMKGRVKQAMKQLQKRLQFDDPSFRLIYQRRYRDRRGRSVWANATRTHVASALEPA